MAKPQGAALRKILSARQRFLVARPVRSIAASLGALSEKWLEPDYFYRRKARRRLVRGSFFSGAMADDLLDQLFGELTEKKLWGLLQKELKDPLALDGFRRQRTGVFTKALGPRLVTHVFAGNVPNPAVVSFILGMLVKSANAGKCSSEDPGFLDIYLQSLAAFDRRLAESNCLIAPRDRGALARWMRASELVVAYGADKTLATLKAQLPPEVSFCGYGHRLSAAVFLKGALTRKTVRRLARRSALDIWRMDQRGCLSPQAFYVQKGDAVVPREFARLLSLELARLSGKENSRPVPFSKKLSLRLAKDRLQARRLKDRSAETWTDPGGRWLVHYEENSGNVPLPGGHQAVAVKAFETLPALCRLLETFRGFLQAVALEGNSRQKTSLMETLPRLGVNRICRAGRMQQPPLGWHHDGRPNLLPWLRWVDYEL